MVETMYNWKRFWCKRTGNIDLSDGGYLTDPEGKYGHHFNPDLRSFEELSRIPCLILLGEPGIGKSTTLGFEFEKTAESVVKDGDLVHPIRDLRSYSSEDRLVRDIFENPTIKAWIDSNKKLYLFLDSLDECLLRIDTIAALLLEQLKRLPTDRLYLRIACRTAELPNMLEEGLKEIWKNESEIYELVPLRRRDVIEAAESNGIVPDVFLEEVDKVNAVPFAIRPVTLTLLIRTFIRDHQLPPTRHQLYEEGCGRLCEETSAARRAAKLIGNLSSKQRMVVAARIAACTIFANRYAIWTEIDRGDVPPEDVNFQALAGKNEQCDGGAIDVTEEVLRETLETGLFSSRGPNRLGWAHQTYSEFLAARFLVQNQVSLPQILSLIVHPGDAKGRIIPQLHETVAWLSGMNNAVFEYVMKVNPEILLRSDVATADPKDKAAIVESLLRLFDEGMLIDRGEMKQYYSKLHHAALDSQLKPYIVDRNKGYMVRRVVIDIAEECKVQSLQDALLQVALDTTESHSVRVDAARAVSYIADDETKKKMIPLVLGALGEDPDDQIKGYSLRAVWPGLLTADELFSSLSLPKRSKCLGAYWDFIEHRIMPHIKQVELPRALQWVEKDSHKFGDIHFAEKLPDAIMIAAWNSLEQRGVLSAFAKAALSRLKQHEEIIVDKSGKRDLIEKNDDKRQALLQELIPLCAEEKDDWILLVPTRTPVLFSKDIPWLIKLLKETTGQKSEILLAKLISRVFDRTSAQQINLIYEAAQVIKPLWEESKWMFEVHDLSSQEARDEKARWLKITRWDRKKEKKSPADPPHQERIRMVLDACESKDSVYFDSLVFEMTLKPDSEYYELELNPDLRETVGWDTASPEIRKRVLEAAKQYLLHNNCVPDRWVGNNTIVSTAISGYKALRLLSNEDKEFVQSIADEIWRKWAPIVLAYPAGHEDDVLSELICIAYSRAPEEVILTLLAELDQGDFYILDRLNAITDKHLTDVLMQKATSMDTNVECYEKIMLRLIDRGVEDAIGYAQKMIQIPLSKDKVLAERSVASAFALIEMSKGLCWQVLSSISEKDSEFFRRIVSKIADQYRKSYGFIQVLTEAQLALLYIRIEKEYPHSTDPRHDGAYTPSIRDNIVSFRNMILDYLKNAGTVESYNAIESIASALPHLDWMKWVMIDAHRNMLQKTWTPPVPLEIIKLAQNGGARLVINGNQLLDVLIESLKRLETELQGESPLVKFLWNETKKGSFRPKDENDLSDYVKGHLDRDLIKKGVIVNREVQIRGGTAAGGGEITDIHVDVFSGTERISAIIETKGCWNRDLKCAMQTQLRDRYLKDNKCSFGLYLVGWFNCFLWDKDDTRRPPRLDLESARKQFSDQASSLSHDGIIIQSVVLNTALR